MTIHSMSIDEVDDIGESTMMLRISEVAEVTGPPSKPTRPLIPEDWAKPKVTLTCLATVNDNGDEFTVFAPSKSDLARVVRERRAERRRNPGGRSALPELPEAPIVTFYPLTSTT